MGNAARRTSSWIDRRFLGIWIAICLAWILVLMGEFTGQSHWLHHDQLIGHNPQPLLIRLGIFLLAWQVMTAAMMLPTVVPTLQGAIEASRNAGQKYPATLFLAAYFLVWTGFALVVFGADLALHHFVDRWPWLAERAGLISGSTLIVAGLFQFTPLKRQCMTLCRHSVPGPPSPTQNRLKQAWHCGLHHGVYCLGCCWALMLLMFAVGVGHLVAMVLLTGVMILEKTTRRGRSIAPIVGLALVVWGSLALIQPSLTGAGTHHHHAPAAPSQELPQPAAPASPSPPSPVTPEHPHEHPGHPHSH